MWLTTACSKIKQSLFGINYRLYAALLFLGFIPTIYTTIRVFFLGEFVGEWSFSIAGQLSWVNLFYEILNEAIILPLFYFVGKVRADKDAFTNRVRTGMLVSLGLYIILSVVVIIFAREFLELMATDASIIEPSIEYIRIECGAHVFGILTQFCLVALVAIGKTRYLYALTLARLVLCVVCDTFLVSTLSVSASLGINGIGYSNIIVNSLLLIVSLALLYVQGVAVFSLKQRLEFGWMKEFAIISALSGVESLVRNVAYLMMVVRMVNIVGEQGTYWVANNFIWGWLLLPILQLGELIKQEVSTSNDAGGDAIDAAIAASDGGEGGGGGRQQNENTNANTTATHNNSTAAADNKIPADNKTIRSNSIGYFIITLIICALWFVTIPAWKPFMSNVLRFSDVDKLYDLVLTLVGFYVLYAVQNVFDSTFYGVGKTHYMLFQSVVTNSIYYGTAYVLYMTDTWVPTLEGIALLFGIGNAFDSVVSLGVYIYFLRKQKLNIFEIIPDAVAIFSTDL